MFQALKRLFQRGEPPLAVVHDPDFGELKWSADDESWYGSYRGRIFSLGYDGSSGPSQSVRTYALSILEDPSWLETSFAQARTEALKEFSDFYTAEVQSLTLGAVHFYVHPRGGERILADVDGGNDDRAWRIEYSGNRCEGIGFDD